MSVLRNLDCLSLVVCSNTTLLKLQTVLFLFFSKFCTSKSGVRLIYGCGLYTDVYGTFGNKAHYEHVPMISPVFGVTQLHSSLQSRKKYSMLTVLTIKFPSTTSDIFKCNVGFHSCNKLIPLN